MEGADAEALAEQSAENLSPLPQTLTVRLQGGVEYTDNLELQNEDQLSDIIFSAGGGLTWNPLKTEHRKFTFDYDGTARWYTDYSEHDGMDHVAAMNGFLDLSHTKFVLGASYSKLSGVETESRQFEDREEASVNASLDQELTGKLSLNASVNYHTSLYDTLQSTDGFYGRLGLNWALTAKATAGLAAMAGYTDSDSDGKEDYGSVLLTAGYEATGKLKLAADAGMQRGQTIGDRRGEDDAHFVFHMTADYQVREKTALSLTAGIGSLTDAVQQGGSAVSDDFTYRLNVTHRFAKGTSARFTASRDTPASAAVDGASIERTTLSAGVTQDLGDLWKFAIDGGYDTSDYTPTEGGAPINRSEDGWFLRSSLTWRPQQATNVRLYYDFRDVSANPDDLSYQENRVGLTVGRSW